MKLLKDLEAARETAILLLTLKVPYPPLCITHKLSTLFCNPVSEKCSSHAAKLQLKPIFMFFLIFKIFLKIEICVLFPEEFTEM